MVLASPQEPGVPGQRAERSPFGRSPSLLPSSGSRRERFLISKLVLPQLLVVVFCNNVGSLKTKRIIHKYQEVVVDKIDDELKSGWQGRSKRKRPGVFVEEDWVREHSVEPQYAKAMQR